PAPRVKQEMTLAKSPKNRTNWGSAARSAGPSRGYFPRAVFFFGFGFLALPVLPGAGSFFGRFGDIGPSFFGWPSFSACAFAFGRRMLALALQGDPPADTDRQARPARAP